MDKPLLCASDRSRIHGLGVHGASGEYKKYFLSFNLILCVYSKSDANLNGLTSYKKYWPNCATTNIDRYFTWYVTKQCDTIDIDINI